MRACEHADKTHKPRASASTCLGNKRCNQKLAIHILRIKKKQRHMRCGSIAQQHTCPPVELRGRRGPCGAHHHPPCRHSPRRPCRSVPVFSWVSLRAVGSSRRMGKDAGTWRLMGCAPPSPPSPQHSPICGSSLKHTVAKTDRKIERQDRAFYIPLHAPVSWSLQPSCAGAPQSMQTNRKLPAPGLPHTAHHSWGCPSRISKSCSSCATHENFLLAISVHSGWTTLLQLCLAHRFSVLLHTGGRERICA